MKKATVIVSGLNAGDNPGPGIGVARSLKKDADIRTEIIGLAYNAMESGLYMDWVVDKSYIMPSFATESEAFLERLLAICDKVKPDMVIRNLDAELPFYIHHAKTLAKRGVHTFLPELQVFRLRGKDHLKEVAEGMGLRLPKTCLVHLPDDLADAVEEMGLPLMVKGIYYEAYRAETLHGVETHCRRLADVWGYPVILQEIVQGEHLNAAGVGSGQGQLMGLVGIKKTSLTTLGKIWTGVTIRKPAMSEAAERFVKHFGWRGPFELECILAGDDIYLIEINPRFPAWIYFAAEVGINLPARMLRHCLNLQNSAIPLYEAGKLFVRYSYELVDEAGALITSVEAEKRLADGTKAYVIDAGLNLLFTSNWYRFNIALDRKVEGFSEKCILYGPLCMNIDVIDEGPCFRRCARARACGLSPTGALARLDSSGHSMFALAPPRGQCLGSCVSRSGRGAHGASFEWPQFNANPNSLQMGR